MSTYELQFTKMNGAGNDFVVFDNREYRFSDRQLSALAADLCARRTGIGADGLLALAAPSGGGHDYRMRYFNADGSPATMCGNGARCLARFARDAGFESDRMRVESDAGTHRVSVPRERDSAVRLYMPTPDEDPAEVALEDLPDQSLAPVYQVWTGTEHVVCFVDEIDEIPVAMWGRTIREAPVFAPAGTNVNFVERSAEESDVRIRVRTYEKGVEAETLACGTGAVAAAWTMHVLFAPETSRIAVQMPGGLLYVGWEAGGGELYLEGGATITFVGTIDVRV